MWPDPYASTLFFFFWMIAVTVVYFRSEAIRRVVPPRWRTLPFLLGMAAVIRLIPALLLPVGAQHDIDSFTMVYESLAQGREVYLSVAGRYPYLPFYFYFIFLAGKLAAVTPLPFVVWVKMWPVLADLGLVALLHAAAGRLETDRQAPFKWGLIYALNPIPLLVSAYHGQFDNFTLFLLLAAWYFWSIHERWLPSAVLLGLAIAMKTWPVILLPLLFLRPQPWRIRLAFPLVAGLIPAGFVLIYLVSFAADPAHVLGRALTHAGSPGYWSLSSLLVVGSRFDARSQLLLDYLLAAGRWPILIGGGLSLLLTRKQPVAGALLTVLLTIFAVTTGMAMQWLVWLVPLAIIAGDRGWLRWYTGAGLIYIVPHLFGIHLYWWLSFWFDAGQADILLRLAAFPTWLVVLGWTVARCRRFAAPAGPGEAVLAIRGEAGSAGRQSAAGVDQDGE